MQLILALDEFGGHPSPARIRNGGRPKKSMIGGPGTQFKKNRNAFLRHWGSWTSINQRMNRNLLNMSVIRLGPPENFSKYGPLSPYEKPPNCS